MWVLSRPSLGRRFRANRPIDLQYRATDQSRLHPVTPVGKTVQVTVRARITAARALPVNNTSTGPTRTPPVSPLVSTRTVRPTHVTTARTPVMAETTSLPVSIRRLSLRESAVPRSETALTPSIPPTSAVSPSIPGSVGPSTPPCFWWWLHCRVHHQSRNHQNRYGTRHFYPS